jgi:ferric-dicitrate binding protein FerR (iron transport regulator)
MDANAGDWTEDHWERLRRYALGELTAPQAQALEAWIAADPQRTRVAESVLRHWAVSLGLGTRVSALNKQDALAEVFRRVLNDDGALRPGPMSDARNPPVHRLRLGVRAATSSRFTSLRQIAGIAAVLVVGVAVGVMWTVRNHLLSRQPNEYSDLERTTLPGQRDSVSLSDGTRVLLAPGTHLKALFTKQQRTVTLDGEAFFTVTHDASRPLTVQLASAVITDVGTRFVVRAYAVDTFAVVAVADGRISVSAGINARTHQSNLGANDVATVSAKGNVRVDHSQDVSPYTSWTAGKLVFRRTPLSMVAADLTRWYGVAFRVHDSSLAVLHITLTLTTQPAAEAAHLLCGLASAKCEHAPDGAFVIAPAERELRSTRARP